MERLLNVIQKSNAVQEVRELPETQFCVLNTHFLSKIIVVLLYVYSHMNGSMNVICISDLIEGI